ncbi:hypothetical protein STRTUCAR8_01413 [Streptomyces turgidiscabies Car8]|uniref:Uncharacterized protein n=1 Tax=Streptomyces turgidiscabies (strain Car8) TaxID=698760 RepID=L7F4G1_STRT8|nr:hypothetical protein STRTUCAR8_01413 [Streptomyces turgidiscabies Car8]
MNVMDCGERTWPGSTIPVPQDNRPVGLGSEPTTPGGGSSPP